MKIFLAYKQTGVSKKILDFQLGKIKEILEQNNHQVFIYYLDEKNLLDKKEIIKKSKQEIEKAELIIGFIEESLESEGMLLELGIAFGLDKEIQLFIKNKVKNEYFLLYGITKNIVFYKDFDEFLKKILEIGTY